MAVGPAQQEATVATKLDDQDEESDLGERPFFVDLFGGVNLPMSRALRRCGWNVTSYEQVHGQDIKDAQVKDAIIKDLWTADAWWSAVPCETTTRARDKPISGDEHGPRPLRDEQHLWGLDGLKPWEQEQVNNSNECILLTTEAITISKHHKGEQAAGIEGPWNCLLWNFDVIAEKAQEAEQDGP